MNMPEPTPHEPFPSLRTLLGQTVVVEGVGDVRGVPAVLIADRFYVCDDDWGQKCAGYLQAEMHSSGQRAFTLNVVEEHGQVGFREPPAAT